MILRRGVPQFGVGRRTSAQLQFITRPSYGPLWDVRGPIATNPLGKIMQKSFRSVALSAAIGLVLVGTTLYTTNGAHAVVPNPARDAAFTARADNVYIITFSEVGLLEYQGEIQGLARTAPDSATGQRLNRHSAAARDYEAYLESSREAHRASIESVLSRPLDITHSYGITFNGIATDLTAAEAAKIAGLPGVKSVEPAGVYYLDTYRGPSFMGADKVWDGSSTPTGIGDRGRGVTVGIIDSGANSGHPSFANDPSCGFSAAEPKLIAVDCSSSSGGICTGSNPQAASGNGHGVHTAGTVAGNTIDNSASPAPAVPDNVTVSGVAPCATVYSYLVCGGSTCNGAWVAAGIQNAVADNVDVINFSISGGTSPWSSSDNDRRFLDAVGNGTFVVASAGNTSPTVTNPVGQVNHRGPWVMSVAASSQDVIIGPGISLSGPGTPPADTQAVALRPGSTTNAASTPTWTDKPVKTYAANIEACTAAGVIPAGTFTGAVAVVRRGTCPFTEKITNAYNAGADMVIIGNNQFGSLSMDTTGAASVPAYSMSQSGGDAIIAFVNANPTQSTGDVEPIVAGTRMGDVLADFSFRGPTPGSLADLTKPDITGPGVDIYAATDPGSGQYELMSGTSMSGPHVAGAGALMKGVHPGWSPMEIRSALMMTAKRDGVRENGTSPWNIDDVGSGRVNVAKAAMAGLTMDETKANFLAANPSGGTLNIKQLNLPALRNMACNSSCTWTRTVKNRLATAGTWTVGSTTDPRFLVSASPSSFTLAPGAVQTITFTASPTVNITTTTGIAFGYVTLTEASGLSPQQHLTAAIRGNKAATLYTLGGTVSGLSGSGLSLSLNGGDSLAIASNGDYSFPGGLPDTSAYEVTVAAQPAGQVCTVADGLGAIAGANVGNVDISCIAGVTNWTVTPSVGSGVGTISPDTALAIDDGDTATFILAPGTGQQVASVTGTCDGTLTGNSYVTNPVTADCTVIANFAAESGGGNGLRISQIYGGGGNSSATYKEKYVELFNAGSADIVLSGKSLQYASVAGTAWNGRTNLSGTIAAHGYFLVQVGSGSTGAVMPVTPDQTSSNWTPAGVNGNIALVEGTDALTCQATACASDPLVIDLVGYGTGAAYEGAASAPATSSTMAGFRAGDGCIDTNDNGDDFSLASPNPRNSGSALNLCSASITWAVTPSVGTPSGVIAPPTAQTVNDGDTATFTLAADPGFQIASVDGTCGGTLTGNSFATAPVTADCTVIANFMTIPPVIDVSPASLAATQTPGQTSTQTLAIANVGGGQLNWSIDEESTATRVAAPLKPAAPVPVVMSSLDCPTYENYAGREPAGWAEFCGAPVPTSFGRRIQASTDMAFALDVRNDNFVQFTLNDFPGQTQVAVQADAMYGMDFDPTATTLYALNDATGELGTINLTTGAFTGIVACTVPGGGSWSGLSIDPVLGTLYASTTTNLYVLNPATCSPTLIGPFGTGGLMIDIAVNTAGQMYGHDIGTDSIYSINTATGAATLIGSTGYDANFAQGMDFDNEDGTLYIFLYTGAGTNTYGTVNLATGAITVLAQNNPLGEFEGATQTAGVAQPCSVSLDIPWLSLDTNSGSTLGGSWTDVTATFDATGYGVGVYTGNLCVTSNDTTQPLVTVPVTMTVEAPLPVAIFCNSFEDGEDGTCGITP